VAPTHIFLSIVRLLSFRKSDVAKWFHFWQETKCNMESEFHSPLSLKKTPNWKIEFEPGFQSSFQLMHWSRPEMSSNETIEEISRWIEHYQRDLEYLYNKGLHFGPCDVPVLRAFDELPDTDCILFPAEKDNGPSKFNDLDDNADFYHSNDESWWSKRYIRVLSRDRHRGWRKRGYDERKREYDAIFHIEALNELPDPGRDLYLEKISPKRRSFHLFPKLPTELRIMIWRATFEPNVLALMLEEVQYPLRFKTYGRDPRRPAQAVNRESREVFLQDHRLIKWEARFTSNTRSLLFNKFKDRIRLESDDLLYIPQNGHAWTTQLSWQAMCISVEFFEQTSELVVMTIDLVKMMRQLARRPILVERFRRLEFLYIYCLPQPMFYTNAVFHRLSNNTVTAERCKEAFTIYFEDLVE
jgi:hypothetical protein